MSLDVTLVEDDVVFVANITHNLTHMADEAGIYDACWYPERIGVTKAKELICLLEIGLDKLKNDPDYFKQFDSLNGGWGLYDDFVPWLEKYLTACRKYPEATITVSR